MESPISKRSFLAAGLSGFGLLGANSFSRAQVVQEPELPTNLPTTQEQLRTTEGGMAIVQAQERHLIPWRFFAYNPHNQEAINVIYRINNNYSSIAMRWISVFMRDWRQNQVRPIDPRLIDIISYIHAASGSQEPVFILSAYRTPRTNMILRSSSLDVATDSLHMEGMAADVRIRGVSSRWIRDAGLYLRQGGVGYYPGADFTHLDTGPVRRWGA